MSQLIVYPRHYTSRSPVGSGVSSSQGDAEVVALYKFYLDRRSNSQTWSFRKETLLCALRLFGDFGSWLSDQVNNPRIGDFQYDFLKDTITYVLTGDRALSIRTWMDLLSDSKAETPKGIQSSKKASLTLGKTMSTIAVLQSWCGQPAKFEDRARGFEDLLFSLYVFFGPEPFYGPTHHE